MSNSNHTATDNKPLASPIVKKPSQFKVIWLLPLAALILCLWLVWHSYNHEDLDITLQFSSAQGITAGKTNVIYNGIIVGKVKGVHATDDLKNVNVTLAMDEKFKPWLTDKTEFWLVKPNVSLSGVTGLETLVSGNYIAMRPNNTGKPALTFTALKNPPSEDNLPGLHISLVADKLNSITVGSPVYFNQIEVGQVTNYLLQPKTHTIIIHIVIHPEYAELVHHNSRFWNVSGFDIKASLKGLKVHAESLTTLIKGGIAFQTPTWEPKAPLANNGDQFILYNSIENAKTGITINIQFPLLHSAISKGTPIIFHGVEVGNVKAVSINNDLEHFTAEAVIDPSAKNLLVEGAHFWVVRPQVSLNGVSDFSSLVNGPYIAIDAPKQAIKRGIEKTRFEGYESRSYAPFNLPGLNLTLKATALHGITIKSPILYKDFSIGNVENVRLGKNGNYVYIDINIYPKYQHLINSSSQFENNSGLSINASLTGIKVNSGTLASLLTGGIVVNTPNLHASIIKPGSTVILQFPNKPNDNGIKLSLITSNLGSIKMDMPVLYLGVPVGRVTGYQLDDPASHVIIHVFINAPYAHLVTPQSQFWNVSGLHLDAGLFRGIQVEAQSLQTIAIGGIAFATPKASKKPLEPGHRFILHPKAKPEWKTWHPAIPLN